jgi:DNA polymerase III subunit gamma/tau
MSYLVLARKYRPKTFGEMVGQAHVVQALGNALTQQRLHHAYLFTGTRGVGKTTVSRILAKSLNCRGSDGQGGITATPCGVCDACRDIDADRYVDYTEMDAASTRGIDDVRELLDRANYKPVQGRFKVYMIDEVHQLTGPAFSALLKTLEEPPEYLKFVLATTDPQKVPVTVLSRCLQFNLRPMAPETVQEHLQHVLQAEGVAAEPQALRLLARAARGSMRDALSLTDQAIAFGGGQLHEAAVRQMLGSVDRSHVFRLIDALALGDGRSVVEVSEALRSLGLNAATTLDEMSAVLQRMAVIQVVPSAAAPEGDSEGAEIARLAAAMPADETQLLYSICLQGKAELGLAPDEYAGLTMVLLRLLAFKAPAQKKTPAEAAANPDEKRSPDPDGAAKLSESTRVGRAGVPPGQVLPVVERPRRSAQQSPVGKLPAGEVLGVPVRIATESPLEATGVAAARVVPTEEGDFWHVTVAGLLEREAVTALVRELALQSQLVARDEAHWMLRVERESLNQPTSRERLQNALAAAGHAVSLSVEVGAVTDSPARRLAAAAAEKQRAAEAIIQADPFVQQMMRDFGAKIVPGSIKPVPNG